jgi:hypothetical protein
MTVSAKLEKLEKGGRISIIVGEMAVAMVDVPYLTRRLWGAGMNIGCDDGLAVARDYTAPFAFSGTLHHVTLDVPPVKPSKADQRLQTRADLAEQ